MDRYEVIQYLIDKKRFKRYLEIGVFNGEVFFKVKARRKYAVDPAFRFAKETRYQMMARNVSNIMAKYFRKTSDLFFQQDAPRLFATKKIDICFIDGMHEYAYALNDAENTLQYLNDGGVIILHDCNPLTAEAAVSYEGWKKNDFAGFWNGDVWKAIVHLRSLRDDINVFTLDTDHGLGIVVKGTPEYTLPFSKEEILQFTYDDFNKNREHWLNLKEEAYLKEYFDNDNN